MPTYTFKIIFYPQLPWYFSEVFVWLILRLIWTTSIFSWSIMTSIIQWLKSSRTYFHWVMKSQCVCSIVNAAIEVTSELSISITLINYFSIMGIALGVSKNAKPVTNFRKWNSHLTTDFTNELFLNQRRSMMMIKTVRYWPSFFELNGIQEVIRRSFEWYWIIFNGINLYFSCYTEL